jgi:predicted phage-related endonuclease
MNSHRTSYDVWLAKSGLLERDQGKINGAADIGNRLENTVIDMFSAETGYAVARNISLIPGQEDHFGPEWAGANLDGVVVIDELNISPGIIVEAKTAGMVGPLSREWGEDGTDEIPEQYLIQVQHQFMVAGPGFHTAYVPALLGGRGFAVFQVRRDEDLIASIKEFEEQFWAGHVITGIPPENSTPSPSVIKRIRREPGSSIPLDMDLVLEWREAVKDLRYAESVEKEVKIRVQMALGTAEAGIMSDGSMITYMAQKRKEYVVAASEFRVMRFKANK